MSKLHAKGIPDICQFWYTTALFRPIKAHQKVSKFATKYPKLAKIGVHQAKKYTGLKKYASAGSGDSDLYQL